MAYYSTCPNCGSNLDPGEKCDCERREPLAKYEPPCGITRKNVCVSEPGTTEKLKVNRRN